MGKLWISAAEDTQTERLNSKLMYSEGVTDCSYLEIVCKNPLFTKQTT